MTTPLNIYCVERTDDVDYDNYSDFVVICATAEEARNSDPASGKINQGWRDEFIDVWFHSEPEPCGPWVLYAKKEELLDVTLIGQAVPGSTPQIVCKSFHAG
jgi:hypothetical protein